MEKSKSMFTTTPPGGGIKKESTPIFKKHTRNYYNLFIALSGAAGAAAVIMSVIISVLNPNNAPVLNSVTLADNSQIQVSGNTITVDQPITNVSGTSNLSGVGTQINLIEMTRDTQVSMYPAGEAPTRTAYLTPFRPLDSGFQANDIFRSYVTFQGLNFRNEQAPNPVSIKSVDVSPFIGKQAIEATLNETNGKDFGMLPRGTFKSNANSSFKFSFYLSKSSSNFSGVRARIGFQMNKALAKPDLYFDEGFEFREDGTIWEYSASIQGSPIKVGMLPPSAQLLDEEITLEVQVKYQQINPEVVAFWSDLDLEPVQILSVPGSDFFHNDEFEHITPALNIAAPAIPFGEGLEVVVPEMDIQMPAQVPDFDLIASYFDGGLGFDLQTPNSPAISYTGESIELEGYPFLRDFFRTPTSGGGTALHLTRQLPKALLPEICGNGKCAPSEFELKMLGSATTSRDNPSYVTASGNYAYVIETFEGTPLVEAFDVSNPESPAAVHYTFLNDVSNLQGASMVVYGSYLYVGLPGHNKTTIYEMSEPGWLVKVGEILGYDTALTLIGEKTLLAADNSFGTPKLTGLDLTDPVHPQTSGAIDTLRGNSKVVAVKVAPAGSYIPRLVVAANEVGGDTTSLQVFRYDSSSGQWVGAYDEVTGQASSMEVYGNYAYVGHTTPQMLVFDITDPSAPKYIKPIPTGGTPYEMFLGSVRPWSGSGWQNLYVRVGGDLKVYNIATAPASPKLIIEGTGANLSSIYTYTSEDFDSWIYGVSAASKTFAVGGLKVKAGCESDCPSQPICGNGICDRPSENIQLCPADCPDYCPDTICSPAEYILKKRGETSVSNNPVNLIVDSRYAFIAEESPFGASNTSFESFFIADPYNLIQRSTLNIPGLAYNENIRIAKAGNYIYISNGYNEIRIVDVSNPDSPVLSNRTLPEDMVYTTYQDYLFIGVSASPDIGIYDVSDPANPTLTPINLPQAASGNLIDVEIRGSEFAQYPIVYALINSSDGTDNATVTKFTPNSSGEYTAVSGVMAGPAYDLEVSGNYAYVSLPTSIRVLDATNPIMVLGSTSVDGATPHELFVGAIPGGETAKLYARLDDRLNVFNIYNDPSHPELIPSLLSGEVKKIYVPTDSRVYAISNIPSFKVYSLDTSCVADCGVTTAALFQIAAPIGGGGGGGRLSINEQKLPAVVFPSMDPVTEAKDDVSVALLTIVDNNYSYKVTAYVDIPQAYRSDFTQQALETFAVAQTYCKERIDAQIYFACSVDYVSFGAVFLAPADGSTNYTYQDTGAPAAVKSLGSAYSDPTTGQFDIALTDKLMYGDHTIFVATTDPATGKLLKTQYDVKVECVDNDHDEMCDEREKSYCLDTALGAPIDQQDGCSEAQMDIDDDNYCTNVLTSNINCNVYNCSIPDGQCGGYNQVCPKGCDPDCAVTQPQVSIAASSLCAQPFEWEVSWDFNPVCVDCDKTELCSPPSEPCLGGVEPKEYGYCDSSGRTYCFPDDPCAGGSLCNNNGICEPELGENAQNCPSDCFSSPICGNLICEAGEDQYNCPADCGGTGPVCGNMICEAGEDALNCPVDCATGPVCGNGRCEMDEDQYNCPADCGVVSCNNDGKCQPEIGETPKNCPADCGGVVCGSGCDCVLDGMCSNLCPAGCPVECAQDPDCGAVGCNRNGICEPWEGPKCPDCAGGGGYISIWCDMKLGKDSCPTVFGQYQGCPYGNKNIFKLEVTDKSAAKDRCYYMSETYGVYPPYEIGTESCIFNIQGGTALKGYKAVKTVFDMEKLIGLTLTTKEGQNYVLSRELLTADVEPLYNLLLDSVEANADVKNALVGTCIADKNGQCTVGKSEAGNYIDIVQIEIGLPLGSPPDMQGFVVAVDGVAESAADFVDGVAINEFIFEVVFEADSTWTPFDGDNDGACDVGGAFSVSGTPGINGCPGWDFCTDTPVGYPTNQFGCAQSQVDADLDGVCNANVDFTSTIGINPGAPYCTGTDMCANTPAGQEANQYGCSWSQVDEDKDGVCNPGMEDLGAPYCSGTDQCADTPAGQEVNTFGCSRPQVDGDNDGLCDPGKESLGAPFCAGTDQCPETYGRAAYFGCPYADKNIVDLHLIDKSPAKNLCTYVAGTTGINGSCKVPFTPVFGPVEMKVFDRNKLNGMTTTSGKLLVKNNKEDLFPEIYEDAALASAVVGQCTIGSDGTCLAGEKYKGDFLVLGKARFIVGPAELTSKTVYFGLPKSPTDFIDGLATPGPFQVVVTVDKTGKFWVTAGQKFTVVGSYLEMIVPQFTVWEGATQVYPFIFYSDSDWTVDVCLAVPEGYQIVEPGTCTQALIGGQPESVLFTLKEVSSPKPDVKVKMKMQHNGKTKNLDFEIPGRRKGKDK